MNFSFDQILIVGDTHAQYSRLFEELDRFSLTNTLLIHVGDGGEGFLPHKKQLRQFELLNNSFKKRGVEYWSIRGNHSDPAYFDGSVNLSNFKLLPDYHTAIINNQKFQFVGGAISIDRIWRKEGVSYWKDEPFVFDETKAEKCDVLITHSSPTWNGPIEKSVFIERRKLEDVELSKDMFNERNDHDKLIAACSPKKHYCGHFHKSYYSEYAGCISKILAELEIIEYIN